MKRTAAGLLIALALIGQSWATEGFEPGVGYYYEHFDPSMKPWKPGQALNLEEVFKNYQYYEILFDQSGTRLTVNKYIQNRKTETRHYRLAPDGGLEKE